MGKEGEQLKKTQFLAWSSLDNKILYSKNERLNSLIMHKFNYPVTSDDLFVIVRSEEMINDLDRNSFSVFKEFQSYQKLSDFLWMECRPKLRDCSTAGETVREMYHKHQPAILFITGKNTSQEQIFEFKEAVRSVPKEVIFMMCSMEDNNINHFLNIFVQTNQGFQEG